MPRSQKRSVLITGATSTIGRQVAELLYYDRRVRGIMAVAREPQRPYYFDEYETSRFTYHSLNILKPRELTNLFLSERFREAEIDTVLHLAIMSRASMDAAARHEINVEGTRVLLNKCVETAGIRKFVFLSSWDVYRILPHNSVLLDEEAELNFDQDAHVYVRDWVDADMLCRAKMDHPRMQVVVLRPTGVVGRNVHLLMNEYLSSSVCTTVAGFNPMVNLVAVRDVMHAIKCAVHKSTKGVFNVVGNETAPLSEFITLAGRPRLALVEPGLRAVNRAQRRIGLTRWNFDVNPARIKFSSLLDGRKAEEVLGYKPQHHVKF